MEIDFESRRIYSKEQSFENMDCLNAYCLDENAKYGRIFSRIRLKFINFHFPALIQI